MRVQEKVLRVEEEEVRVEEEALRVEEDELARVEDLAFPAKEFFFADLALRGMGMGTETFDATLELERFFQFPIRSVVFGAATSLKLALVTSSFASLSASSTRTHVRRCFSKLSSQSNVSSQRQHVMVS